MHIDLIFLKSLKLMQHETEQLSLICQMKVLEIMIRWYLRILSDVKVVI